MKSPQEIWSDYSCKVEDRLEAKNIVLSQIQHTTIEEIVILWSTEKLSKEEMDFKYEALSRLLPNINNELLNLILEKMLLLPHTIFHVPDNYNNMNFSIAVASFALFLFALDLECFRSLLSCFYKSDNARTTKWQHLPLNPLFIPKLIHEVRFENPIILKERASDLLQFSYAHNQYLDLLSCDKISNNLSPLWASELIWGNIIDDCKNLYNSLVSSSTIDITESLKRILAAIHIVSQRDFQITIELDNNEFAGSHSDEPNGILIEDFLNLNRCLCYVLQTNIKNLAQSTEHIINNYCYNKSETITNDLLVSKEFNTNQQFTYYTIYLLLVIADLSTCLTYDNPILIAFLRWPVSQFTSIELWSAAGILILAKARCIASTPELLTLYLPLLSSDINSLLEAQREIEEFGNIANLEKELSFVLDCNISDFFNNIGNNSTENFCIDKLSINPYLLFSGSLAQIAVHRCFHTIIITNSVVHQLALIDWTIFIRDFKYFVRKVAAIRGGYLSQIYSTELSSKMIILPLEFNDVQLKEIKNEIYIRNILQGLGLTRKYARINEINKDIVEYIVNLVDNGNWYPHVPWRSFDSLDILKELSFLNDSSKLFLHRPINSIDSLVLNSILIMITFLENIEECRFKNISFFTYTLLLLDQISKYFKSSQIPLLNTNENLYFLVTNLLEELCL